MKNFKNYMYCNSEHKTYAKVYHNIMDLSERYYSVDEIIRMIEMWSDECIEWNKNKEEDK